MHSKVNIIDGAILFVVVDFFMQSSLWYIGEDLTEKLKFFVHWIEREKNCRVKTKHKQKKVS